MQCLNGDVKAYRTKWAKIQIGKQLYYCKVGVVPHIDCAALIGRDCPLLSFLLKQRAPPTAKTIQAEEQWKELSLGPGD